MPGSVANATVATVMPAGLCRLFERTDEWAAWSNRLRDGREIVTSRTSTARRSWALVRRMTAAQLSALELFYVARRGSAEPFWFYDPWETSPKFSPDPTGTATAGRYAVRFEGQFSVEMNWPRHFAEFRLVEVG